MQNKRNYKTLRLNFQFDIDSTKKCQSILQFPPIHVKYDRFNNELALNVIDTVKYLSPFNKPKSKINNKIILVKNRGFLKPFEIISYSVNDPNGKLNGFDNAINRQIIEK